MENMGCEPCRNKACPNNAEISSGCIARHIHSVEQMLRCKGYTDKQAVSIMEKQLESFKEGGCVGLIKIGGKVRNFAFELSDDTKRGDLPSTMENVGKALDIAFFKAYSDMNDLEKQDFIAGGG